MELPEELRQWIGRQSPPVPAPGPIEWSDVRRYINATGDANPLWGQTDAETNPGRTGALAPPGMILDVLRPVPGQDLMDGSGGRHFPSLAGFAGMITVPNEVARLNAGVEIEWVRPPRIGDWITVRFKILDVTAQETRSGPSVFITEQREYFDQRGELVAVVQQVTVRKVGVTGTAPGAA